MPTAAAGLDEPGGFLRKLLSRSPFDLCELTETAPLKGDAARGTYELGTGGEWPAGLGERGLREGVRRDRPSWELTTSQCSSEDEWARACTRSPL